mmetsp:Transcript_930/g.1407  ORF Transcript_930/g.1407 Transcript_930/m.1407 type:complete len:412 (+) Transcript_930:139-1374(+)
MIDSNLITINETVDMIGSWCCRISGLISLLCSALLFWVAGIIIDCNPKNNILKGLCCMDIIQSISFVASSAPSIRGSFYGSIGNSVTCNIQGFFVQLGFGVPCYNASLALFYLLVVSKKYSTENFTRRVEPFCHIFSIGLPLLTAIILLSLNKLGHEWSALCWVFNTHRPDETFVYAILFGGSFVSICSLFVIYSFGSITLRIRKQSRRMARYNFSGQEPVVLLKMQRIALKQGLLYTSACLLTYFPTLLVMVCAAFGIDQKYISMQILVMMQNIFLPLHGFWNLIIFSYPLVRQTKARNESFNTVTAFCFLLSKPKQCHELLKLRPTNGTMRQNSNRTKCGSQHSQICASNRSTIVVLNGLPDLDQPSGLDKNGLCGVCKYHEAQNCNFLLQTIQESKDTSESLEVLSES